jgi:hypothetical protein
MEPSERRARSWKVVRKLGLAYNPHLPLLPDTQICRTASQVVGRLLVMAACGFCYYKFDRGRALAWLKRERCLRYLTHRERQFLGGDDSHAPQMYWQINGLWVLCWAVGAMPTLDVAGSVPETLVHSIPAIPKDESAGPFRRRAKLRSAGEILDHCDLAYCLHWALRDARLRGRRLPRTPEYEQVYERRRALEWLLCDEDWDEVTMDT